MKKEIINRSFFEFDLHPDHHFDFMFSETGEVAGKNMWIGMLRTDPYLAKLSRRTVQWPPQGHSIYASRPGSGRQSEYFQLKENVCMDRALEK